MKRGIAIGPFSGFWWLAGHVSKRQCEERGVLKWDEVRRSATLLTPQALASLTKIRGNATTRACGKRALALALIHIGDLSNEKQFVVIVILSDEPVAVPQKLFLTLELNHPILNGMRSL